MAGRTLTILLMPESAYGPTNNCIGIGDVLRRRGHRVVFAAEASWRGRLEPLGFEEDLVDLVPPAEGVDGAGEQDPGQFWKDFIRTTAPEFRKPTIQQGAPPLRSLEFIHEGTVNLYVYPELADYAGARPLGPSWHRLDSSVRETERTFTVPDPLAGGGGALIYFSLGSLGSLGAADVELMRRVISCLARTRTATSCPRARSPMRSSFPRTCGGRSSCRKRRSSRYVT